MGLLQRRDLRAVGSRDRSSNSESLEVNFGAPVCISHSVEILCGPSPVWSIPQSLGHSMQDVGAGALWTMW